VGIWLYWQDGGVLTVSCWLFSTVFFAHPHVAVGLQALHYLVVQSGQLIMLTAPSTVPCDVVVDMHDTLAPNTSMPRLVCTSVHLPQSIHALCAHSPSSRTGRSPAPSALLYSNTASALVLLGDPVLTMAPAAADGGTASWHCVPVYQYQSEGSGGAAVCRNSTLSR
jgi:hypothetical protein